MNLSIPPEFAQNMREKHEIKTLTPADSRYPALLREIPNPPALLYYRGAMEIPEEFCLAVVGTRRTSNYGRRVTPQLIQPLSRSGITIVSGLAYGIDSFAHQAAVDCGGRTIAVLPGGIDTASIYPRNHIALAENILACGGALISEYPPGTEARKHHFLARNRIIAGLALGTLVVECDVKSGALITSSHALDQDRSVYAVPGPIDSVQSRGPHKLIKDGAMPVTSAEDLFDDLRVPMERRFSGQAVGAASPAEKLILDELTEAPRHRDEIIASTKLPAAEIIAALTFLEMSGIIRQLDTGQYLAARPL